MLKVSGLTLSDLNKSDQTDQVKKIFKYVADISRKIEEKHQSAERVEDVFSLELLNLRTRLKELAMKMLSVDPKKSGVKVLEHYWRKGFHEPYSVARQLKGNGWSKFQSSLIQSHLLSGIGTYHHLILYFSEKYGWKSEYLLDFTFNNSYGWSSFPESKKSVDAMTDDELDQTWVETKVFKCLVWLGDLARYLETDHLSSLGSPVSATRYYQLATMLAPDVGQPYNNLAMLAGNRNYGLDQLYLYLKCVCCKVANENGQVNLKRLFDKPIEFGTDTQNLVGGLMQLVKMVFDGEQQDKVTTGCQHSLASLHTCLEHGVSDMSDAWLKLCISVIILLVQHKKEPVCQAWLMAIMSHLAGKIVTQVLEKYPELEIKEAVETVEEPKEVKEEGGKKRRNKLENMLRRRRAGQSGSEGEDSEESSDELFDSDEDISEEEEDDDDNDSDDFLVGSSSEEDDDDDDDVIVEEPLVANQSELVELCNENGLLSAFILCQTWLMEHPFLLAQTGQGSEQLWQNMIFTILCLSPRANLTPSQKVQDIIQEAENNKTFPLPEDWLIRGHNSVADAKVNWTATPSKDDGKDDVMRMIRLAEFRDWLCLHPDSKITWDKEKNMARFRKVVEESDKKNVMKHMAELWLRQEVKDLEKEAVKEGGILVVDASALVSNLQMIKRTLGLKKFTLIIPTIAVHQLDGLKKTERGAREAIRWLERELARGNKWLKAQKSGETSTVENSTGNTSKHQLQLVQCLAFYVGRNESVTLLTGDHDILNGEVEFLGDMKKEIRIESVDGFVPRVLGLNDKSCKPRRRRDGKGRRRRDVDDIG